MATRSVQTMRHAAGAGWSLPAVDDAHHLMESQLALLSHRQARRAGLSDAAIRHRVDCGRWISVRSGVYAATGSAASWERDVLAALLDAGEPAWASHPTSARLWTLLGLWDDEIEISVPLERRPRVIGVRVHRTGTLLEPDLRVIRGIPALSPARTIADLSSRFDVDELGTIVDDALRRGLLSLRGLDRVVRHLHRKAPGRSPKKLAAVLVQRVPGYHPGGSELERRIAECLAGAGRPAPIAQHKVVVDGRAYYLDFAYPEVRLALEVDGFDFHRSRVVFDSDRRRQNDLVAAGWTVLRFTSRSTAQEIVTAVRTFLFGRIASP